MSDQPAEKNRGLFVRTKLSSFSCCLAGRTGRSSRDRLRCRVEKGTGHLWCSASWHTVLAAASSSEGVLWLPSISFTKAHSFEHWPNMILRAKHLILCLALSYNFNWGHVKEQAAAWQGSLRVSWDGRAQGAWKGCNHGDEDGERMKQVGTVCKWSQMKPCNQVWQLFMLLQFVSVILMWAIADWMGISLLVKVITNLGQSSLLLTKCKSHWREVRCRLDVGLHAEEGLVVDDKWLQKAASWEQNKQRCFGRLHGWGSICCATVM